MTIYKHSEYTFNVNTTSQGTYNSAFKFSTQDVGTAKLIFNLRKDNAPLPLSAVTGKLVLVPANGKKRIRDITLVDKVNGIAEYVLDNDEIKMYGTFKAELVLVYSNGQAMSAHRFGFEVTQSLMDQDIVPIAEYYIDDFESLKEKIEELYNESVQTIEELRDKFEDLEKIETKEGAQIKADEALSAAKSYTETHISDTANPHKVTKGQVGLDKVDNIQQAAKSDFDKHNSDNTRHITSEERNKWNGSQLFKITADSGTQKINLTSGTFYDALKDVGTVSFYGTNAVTDSPSKSSLRGMQLVGQAGIGMGYAVDVSGGAWWFFYNVNHTAINWIPIESTSGAQAKVDVHANKTDIHVTLDDKTSWNDVVSQFRAHNYNQERHTSTAERNKWNGSVTFANITLKNGATAGTRTPIYAKWGAFLLLRGHVRTDPEIIFGSIPSSMIPPGGAVVTVPLSGTGGTANLIVYENGDLKIKYPDPSDSSKLGGGYYIDVVIGYQEGAAV
ncbi:phage baseplate upper protein [Bacillus inaquosorum]|uniref:BppU family phage baseplate upper protein n=1 Tax=Bacillus inaquosorum TaxID=483913 RepID=UPI00227E5963|nr:BppU family phage baseplate upper protein [Bacillus inaquosorum]MCY8085109.1 phage baseplate upper protein [Bacillus inaquosorum]